MIRAFASDRHEVPLPEGHRFPMGKYRALRERLVETGLLPAEALAEAPLATVDELCTVHTAAWVSRALEGGLDPAEERRLGLPWSPGRAPRAPAPGGGPQAAARAPPPARHGGHHAGGTHHAFADHGEGYCVFNDLAVAAAVLLAEGRVRRVAIVDLDVHQGNGTAAIFAGDDRVFTFSMHGEKNFPFRKQPSSLDVDLPDGTGDAAYLDALDRHLPEVLDRSAPDLVLYQAGVDPLAGDALGRLALSLEGLAARDARVLEACKARDVPVTLTMGGGYARPIERSLEAHLGTYRVVRATFG